MRFLLLCLFVALPCLAAPPSDKAPAKAVLTVMADDNYPPYAFRDSRGELNGYIVDMWKLWEEKTGVRVELMATDWDKALKHADAGKVDVIDTIFRTEEREERFEFSPPYAQIPVTIYAHSSIGGIADIKTLRGFLIGVKTGDACADNLEKAGIQGLQRYTNYETVVQAAVAGQIKVFCLDEPSANYFLYRAHAEKKFNKAFQLYVGELHRAVRKGNTETLALLDKGFAAISAAEQQKIHDKWMGATLGHLIQNSYVGKVLLVVLAIGGLLALWVFTLARTVKQRTAQLESERAHLRVLVETIPDMVWLKDRDGVFLTCNPTFERLFGATKADIVGKTDYDFVNKELADAFRENDHKAMMAGKPTSNEEWLVLADTGYRGLFETIKTPLCDREGNLVGVLGIARDITERKQMEDARRISEQKFAAAFRSSPDAIIISLLSSGRIVDVNTAVFHLTGYSAEEMIGYSGVELDLWPDASLREYCFTQLRDRGTIVEKEGGFRIKSGEIRVGLVSAELLEFDEQKHILWVVRDITERKLAEKTIRASEEKFAAAFRSSPDPIIITSINKGVVIDVNEALTRITGYQREEMIGRQMRELNLWGGSATRNRFLTQIREKGRVIDMESTFRIKSGEVRIGLGSAELVEIDGQPHILGIIHDITKRKSMEDALRVSEQKFAAAFRSCPDAIIISSTNDGCVIDVNIAASRITGYKREEMIGQRTSSLSLWADATCRDRCIDHLRNNQGTFEGECNFRTKAGEIRIGQVSAELIEIDGHSHILGVISDVTERRQAEANLEAANQRLLALSARLLQVQEEERRTLARELHDEIGQSLTAQKITLQTLSIRPEAAVFREQIGAAVDIADTVLQQVRQMSLDLRPAQLDDLGLSAAIRWNLERQSRLADFTPHFVTSGVPSDLHELIAIACYRISQEALTNTIKHAHAANVWISLDVIDEELCLEVRDDGRGFNSTLLKEYGSNMGMVSMQERAALANGRLEIIAQSGAGCSVKAIFPMGRSNER